MKEDQQEQYIHKKVASQEIIKQHITIKRLALFSIAATIITIPIKSLILTGAIVLPLWMYCGMMFNKSKQEIEYLKEKYNLE